MNTGSGPKTPDPQVQANAEAAANRYNIVGPSGTQTWTQGDRQIIGYDSKGKPQYGQQSTQNIKLGDSEQKQFDTRNAIAESLLGSAKEQLPSFANDPFSYDNQGSKAGKASYERQLAYLQPEFDRENEASGDRLANQGIPLGSEAYNEEMDRIGKRQDFAKSQAARESEVMGTQLGLSERQQRYNELAAALGSQQLTPVQALGTQAAPIDVAGAYTNANNANLAKYNAGAAGQNAGIGALGQLGSAAITQWSDERLKDDVEQVGELPTGEGIYEYSYKWEEDGEPKHTGVMAQEIEHNYPEAVHDTSTGFKAVDYRKLISQAMAA